VPTALSANVSAAELDRYALNVRIDEIQRRLATGNVIPPERERSPSPPPTYDGAGRRTNTREVRYRKKLETERVTLMDRAIKLDPNYRPPADYHQMKRNMKPTEKVYLPLKEFPDINFFGLLVGPRGNTLKKMERESGAKISIRGRGSVKEGKGRPGDEDDEEMHCVVQADDVEKVRRCIKAINLVIETVSAGERVRQRAVLTACQAASTPEAQNDHKRNQLRELAALNGTLRDDEGQVCQNCGQKGHRRFACPEERNMTAHIICHRCGGQGHLARDCTQIPGMMQNGGPGGPGGPGAPGGGQFDSEYANLMAELGEGGPRPGGAPGPGGPGPQGGQPGQPGQLYGPDGKKIPPWRDPNMWNPPGGRMMGGGGMGMGMGMGGGMGMGMGGPMRFAGTGANGAAG
jgi:splicing factor 1